ncbi:MAG: hypothetical protein GXP15_17845 [Gammaproteobacteria bacterium]|nr:hypothetical protein [Gammaproteobacteria bacterium]
MRGLIEAGSVLATVDQHADLLAVYGIEYALEILASGAQLTDKSTPVDLVTRENIH